MDQCYDNTNNDDDDGLTHNITKHEARKYFLAHFKEKPEYFCKRGCL